MFPHVVWLKKTCFLCHRTRHSLTSDWKAQMQAPLEPGNIRPDEEFLSETVNLHAAVLYLTLTLCQREKEEKNLLFKDKWSRTMKKEDRENGRKSKEHWYLLQWTFTTRRTFKSMQSRAGMQSSTDWA